MASNAAPPFRKASDTRALPEAPKPSLESLRKQVGQLTGPSITYGPNIVNLSAKPLTRSEAQQLLYASGFPDNLKDYENLFIEELMDRHKNLNVSERRPAETLINLAKNPCSREPLLKDDGLAKGPYVVLSERVKEVKKYNEELGAGDKHAVNIEDFLKGYTSHVAIQLVLGFDVLSKTHFVFDGKGNVIDVTKEEKPRYSKMCLPYLEGIKSYQSRYIQSVKEMSDPYKGSQQGTGKTRKHKKKSRKTRKHKKLLRRH